MNNHEFPWWYLAALAFFGLYLLVAAMLNAGRQLADRGDS